MGGGYPCCCGPNTGQDCCACDACDVPDEITVTIAGYTPGVSFPWVGGCELNGTWVLPYFNCQGVQGAPTGNFCNSGVDEQFGVFALYTDNFTVSGCTFSFGVLIGRDHWLSTTGKMFIYGSILGPSFYQLKFCYVDPSDLDCRGKTGLSATIEFNSGSTTPTVTIDLP